MKKKLIILIHGLVSELDHMNKIKEALHDDDSTVEIVQYGYLNCFLGSFPFVRNLVAMYVATKITALGYKYPEHEITVLAYSFGTLAISRALPKLGNLIKINKIILVGSIIKRSFNWDLFPDIKVYNFIGLKDKVVTLARLWGAGVSGVKGFINKKATCKKYNVSLPLISMSLTLSIYKSSEHFDNVHQYPYQWTHSDIEKGIDHYSAIIHDYKYDYNSFSPK